mmetsp:Transcript_130512/g.292027  ORF Transcript_130512/g.292027 Transcript_130512/m.292027 type:complete len:217 (-) Transcript_130512:250-900(-)
MDSADAPHATDVTIGIPAIEFVAVVQSDRGRQCLARARRPLKDLLGPIHTQEAVHLSLPYHLELRSVPEVVVGARRLERLGAVDILPCIALVVFERALCPIRRALQGVIALVVEAEIVRKLTAHNSLLNEGLAAPLEGLATALSLSNPTDTQGAVLCRDLPKVEVRGEARERIGVGIIAFICKESQTVFAKVFQKSSPGNTARHDAGHGGYRPINL